MHKLASDVIATRPELTCKVEMQDSGPDFSGNPCGRPIYSAPEHDAQAVCIMHSNDPKKDSREFQREFERILDEAEKTETKANFTHFVFPNSDFRGRTFNSACSFFRAVFTSQSNFIKATFNGDVNFALAKFARKVAFVGATFNRSVVFVGTNFDMDTEFGLTKFAGTVSFQVSKFNGEATFVQAVFDQGVSFGSTIFGYRAHFGGAQFIQEADFRSALFLQSADFGNVIFTGNARFSSAVFSQMASFRTAKFFDAAIFRDTRFRCDLSTEPGLDFTDVKVEKPEKVEFHGTDLGQALFHNTDLSKMNFTLVQWRDRGRVRRYRWRRQWYRLRRFGAVSRRNAWLKRWELLARLARPLMPRLCLFEEEVALRWAPQLRLSERRFRHHSLSDHLAGTYHQLKQAYGASADFRTTSDWRQLNTNMRKFYGRLGWAWARLGWALKSLKITNIRNYSLIAETYQQLKRNYDAKGDYWIAGYWHYGEMEMKRLHSRWRWKPLRWLGQHFSLIALYKYASAYGESYTMPLFWLIFFVAAFAFLYPVPGIEFTPPPGNTSGWLGYVDWKTFFYTHPAEHPASFWGMILHSLMTSISVAGFQRELRYVPSYPWGRMLALFELLLTTTLGGLFLLAIRRQFKRS